MKTYIVVDLFRGGEIREIGSDEIMIHRCGFLGDTLGVSDSDGLIRPILVVASEAEHPDYMGL